MCNIAGYVGSRDAAPILIDMIRAQEGLNGGFYTGIATMGEGKIRYGKVVGDLSELLRRTDAASLTGNIGIIHSRTPGKLGDEWAHPFVCERGGEILSAQVYNGSLGIFKDLNPKRAELAERLLSDGFKMNSHVPSGDVKNLILNDGSRVHVSDLMCQLVSKNFLDGDRADLAMEKGFCEIPAEIVGLSIFAGVEDSIVFARINMPMFVAFCDHGAYLASSPTAFPADAKDPILLPALSSGFVKRDSFSASPFENDPASVAPITARVIGEGYAAIREALRTGKHTVPELAKLVKPMFDGADCIQASSVIYASICELKKQGLLKIERGEIPGVLAGLKAPVDYLYI